MGAIEDIRKAAEEFIAPTINEHSAKIEALPQRIDMLEKHFDHRFDEANRRFDEVMNGINHLIRYNTLEARLTALEQQKSN